MTPTRCHATMRLSTLALPVLLLACASPTGPDIRAVLAAAPSTATVGGAALVLDAFLWLDFMPVAPPDGQPLAAVVRVRRADGGPLPANVTADSVWVIFRGDTWQARLVDGHLVAESPPFYEAVARGGPKWGPGVTADVVARVRVGAERALLPVNDRMIGRTD